MKYASLIAWNPHFWYNHRHRKDNIGLHPLFEVETYPEFVKLMQNDFKKVY